jgi:hypothetical protein
LRLKDQKGRHQSSKGSDVVNPYRVHGELLMCKILHEREHDFAAMLQNDTVWGQMKEISPKQLATLPFSAMKTLGLGLLDQYLKSMFGLH